MIRLGIALLVTFSLVACSTNLQSSNIGYPGSARLHHVSNKVVQNPGQRWVSFSLPQGFNDQPEGSERGYDSNTWVTVARGCSPTCLGYIDRYAMDGSYAEFPVPNGNLAVDLVRGPAGLLWFTEPSAGQVGSISPTGTIVEYPLRIQSSAPNSIALGADGNAWFTEPGVNKIGRITAQGVITEFNVPSQPNAGLLDITNGPDGKLWFTENTFAKVGRITTLGQIKEYSIGGNLESITMGPDHNLWITDEVNNQIVRVTTKGVSTKFQIPTASSEPGNIIAGPDGNLWFGESSCDANYLARVTTGGVFTEYPLDPNNPCTSGNLRTTRGSDGNLWIEDRGVIDVYLLAQISTNPQSISLMVGQNQNLTVAEPRYHSTFNASSSNDLVATVAPNGPKAFVVSAVGVGSCAIVISDNRGNSVPVPVVVN